jgi:hypothetical protein
MRRFRFLAWSIGVLVLLALVYAWAGYRLAPRLIAEKLPQAVAAATGQRLTLGAIEVQPFRLSVDVTDIALTEPDGALLFGAKRLYVDARLASIWRRGVILRAIVLDEPRVNLVLRPDGSLNLMAVLASKDAKQSAEGKSGTPLLVSIGDMQVNHGVIDATDERRGHVLRQRVAPINVRVQDFTTSAGGEGRFHIVGRGERGTALTLDGRVAVAPFAIEGTLSLQGLPARTAWELAGEYDRIDPPAGAIDVKTLYRISSRDEGVRVNLDALALDARDLALRGKGAADDWIKVAELSASEASVDVRASLVRIPDLRVRGAAIRAWVDADGGVNLAALAPPVSTARDGVAATGDAPSQPSTSGAWRIEAPRLRVTDSSVAFEDRRTATPVEIRMAPLELDVDGFATDAKGVKVALRTGFNETGRIGIAGDWRLDGRNGAFEVDAQSLPIAFFQPWLDRGTDLVLRDGAVSAKGRLEVGLPPGTAASIAFDGNAALASFHSVDRALREDFVRFGDLALTGIGYRSSPASLRVRDVLARAAYFKFVIAPDQTTNIADVLAPRRLGKASEPSAAAAPPAPATKVRIDRVRVADSSANFADLSIRPNFFRPGVAGHGRTRRQSGPLRAGRDPRRGQSARGEPLYPALGEFPQHRNADLHAIFRPFHGVQDREGQTQCAVRLPDRSPQARCEAQVRARPVHARRQGGKRRSRPPADEARDRAAERPQWRDRHRPARQRLAR